MINDEWSLIDRIASVVSDSPAPKGLVKGIGDDCAVYNNGDGTFGLFSTDISIENVHFDLSYCSASDIGYKAMAGNISDIFAMGGDPVLALVSLALPVQCDTSFVDELYSGMNECAVKHGLSIAGGDTSKSEKVIVNISIYGKTTCPVYRSGARSGDSIFITKWNGSSRLGLEVLRSGDIDRNMFPVSVSQHLRPSLPEDIGRRIVKPFSPTSMIDVSDGIVSELTHICGTGNLGYIISHDALPVSDEIVKFCKMTGKNAIDYILNSGEEYGLLFTSSVDTSTDDDIICIGRITESGAFIQYGNKISDIENHGFNHFREYDI